MSRWRNEMSGAGIVPFGSARGPVSDCSLDKLLDSVGVCVGFPDNARISGDGSPTAYLYRVLEGAVRIRNLSRDGSRRVTAFYLPGDVFGHDRDENHLCSPETIGESVVLMVKRSVFLMEATQRCSGVAQLWAHTMSHVQREQAHMQLRGCEDAHRRISAFLLDTADRLSRIGNVVIHLPIEDIADYLGTSVELVSETLGKLERNGRITISPSRRIISPETIARDLVGDRLAA